MSRLLVIAFLFASCSHHRPNRKIASYDQTHSFGKVERSKSLVTMFPPEKMADGNYRYYFYLQLKDAKDRYVDVDLSKLSLKSSKGEGIEFSFERLLVGRYYVILEDVTSAPKYIDVFLEGKPLKEKFKMVVREPDPGNSKMKILKNHQHQMLLELRLFDKQKKPLDISHVPEIEIDGIGMIENIKYVKAGIWHVNVTYPDQNQVMYFSVRVSGVNLRKIMRYQHVEK